MSAVAYHLNANSEHLCVIIGLGLIGSNIEQQLSFYAKPVAKDAVFHNDWDNPAQITDYLKSLVDQFEPTIVDIVWSGGKAGFDADQREMSDECLFFESFLESLTEFKGIKLTVNLISSAGGVYEGIDGLVSSIEGVAPMRHYGEGKLRQESNLLNQPYGHRVYRASSVYGVRLANMRMGLLNVLIYNAKAGLSTTMYANQNTLRDYIFSTDLAGHIVKNIVSCSKSRLEVLASGRPTSINMLINMISRVTKRNVQVNYQSSAFNATDIVFAPKILPMKFTVTSLEEGISLLNQSI